MGRNDILDVLSSRKTPARASGSRDGAVCGSISEAVCFPPNLKCSETQTDYMECHELLGSKLNDVLQICAVDRRREPLKELPRRRRLVAFELDQAGTRSAAAKGLERQVVDSTNELRQMNQMTT